MTDLPAALPEPPRLVPWTFETRPREMVWVYKKGYITDRLVTAWRDDGVEIGCYERCSYSDFFLNWVQRGGAPCGREETT